MARVLLLASGPPERTGFLKHRVANISDIISRQHSLNVLSVCTGSEDQYHPFSKEFKAELKSQMSLSDVVVTAGPFHPMLALSEIPKDIPVWVDYPSDPLADAHAWRHAPKSTLNDFNQAMAKQAALMAISRGDAFGLISEELRHSFIGQMLLAGRSQVNPFDYCHLTPIARPQSQALVADSRAPEDELRLLICGVANAWLNIDAMCEGLSKAIEVLPRLRIDITGSPLGHYPRPWETLLSFAEGFEQVRVHNWVNDDAFLSIVRQCHAGVWLDRHGVEPVFGSRTRAVLMLHHNRGIIATPSNQWLKLICEKGFLRPATDAQSLKEAIINEYFHPSPQVSKEIQNSLNQEVIFSPLEKWLEEPNRTHQPLDNVISSEWHKLQHDHFALKNSPSVRGLNRIHQQLQSLIDPLRSPRK